MKKRITESRVITKNVYKDYHLLKIHNGPSIQFKKSGNDYIVRVVTAPHTVDKNELKKMGFGTQSNTKSANDYNFTNGIQMNDVTLNKSQFEKLVSVVEKAYKAFIADIGDFYSRGKILDDVRGARRVNEGVRISLFDPNKNKILKTLSVDRNYREAEKEVETLNKRLSTSEKNKGYYWKITTIGESVNEDVSIKDGKYHFYSKDGLAHLTYNGKEIASGDFDFEGGNTYWLNHSSWKGQKAFDSGKEAIAYFKKNQIVNESGGTLKIEKGKDGKYYWEFKFNSGKVEKWPHGFDDKASAQKDFMYRMKYLSENSKDFNSFMKNVKQFESVNESKYNKDLDKIEAAVKNAKSFMGIGAELKKAGIKYDFSTSMIPMYMIKVPGNTIAVVNKKYAAGAEREVGDTAIGLLETKSIKESKFKSGDKVTVKYPTLVKPIKGVVSNILKGPDGDIVVLKGNNGVWDEKYVSLAEALTKSNLRNTIKSIIREETEYQQFFKKALEKAGKSIPDMSDEEKKAFFNKIDAAWKGKGEKNESLVNEYDKWYNTRIQAKNIFRMLKQKYSNNISKMKDGLEDILKQNKTKNDQAEVLRQEFNKYFKVKEELTGDQHKLDVDGDGEIEASDLAALRAGKKVDEGIWPKSKLPQSFQFALAPELKKNFKGIFYSVGNDIYHNDKKVLSVDGDRDSVNSIIKQLKSKIKESVNERYTGNSGDKLTHKYDKNIEIELIEPTNKGWKVYQTDKGNKRKIAYFDKQDIVGNKALFESVNESKINWKDFYTMAKDSSGYNPQFQKKYGKLLDRPHIVDALKKSKDFNSFVKSVKQFESKVNESQFKVGDNVIVTRKDGKEYTGKVEKLNPLKLRTSSSDTMVIPNTYIKDIVVKETVNEEISVFDERSFGKKGIIIMIDDNGKKVSAIFKDKKNADKYNRNDQSDIEALLKIAKTKPFRKAIDEAVNEIANSKGYKPKDAFGARIIQAIDTNIKKCVPKKLKDQGLSNEEILDYGKTFLQVVRNGINAAFKFNYKIHPDVDFPMRKPKDRYWRFDSREDMEKYLKVFLADLKKLDSMIVSYLQKPTLKYQQQITDFWNRDIIVDSSKTGGFAAGIMSSDTSKQSFYEAVNEDNGNLMKIGSTMTVGGDGSGMIKPAKMKLISIDYLPNEKDYSYKFKGGGRTQYYMGSTLAKKLKGKSVNEVSYDSQGNLKVKKKYNALSDYEKVAKKGDYIWVGNNENDFKGAGKELLSKVLGKDSDGNVILSPFGRNKKHTISQKNQMVVVVEGLNEGATVFDERSFGKKGIIIMIDDNGKKVSAIFKDKKNADKYNRNNQSDIEALLKIAKTKPFGKAIDEAVNEGKKVFKVNTQIGKSKYSVSSHDGVSTHKDGSPFWDIKIFSNKAEMERGIADLKKQGYIQEALFRGGKTRNRSIKENATRTAAEIGSLTGMNKNFIQKFIDDNKLDIEKVFQYVKGGKTKDRMDFVTALSGKPGNTYQKKLIKMFGEGINEDCGCNSVNEVSIDAVRKNALNDKNTSNWKLDAGIKKRMQTRSQFGNLTSSNDVKFLTSPKVKVIDLGKDDVYIFTDGEREMIFRLPERGAEAYNFYKLKSLSKARPVVSTYYTDKVKD